MELSAEDALRINVLLASPIEAVRIDESSMTLYALSEKGEARIKLNPNCRDEPYLRRVREALSSHVLGSPGGYPVYLKRWTRMGQTRDGMLESLLLLGEPEAVVAVVNACGITGEIARRAWWASQSAENARCMLRQKPVAAGEMGNVLADFLVEFLPFEEEAKDIIDSVRLVLQPGLISAETRQKIWEKSKHKNAYYIGFLHSVPDDLPDKPSPHPGWEQALAKLEGLLANDNPYATQLCRLLSAEGQSFLATVETVLQKPSNQDVIVELFLAIDSYFDSLHMDTHKCEDMNEILQSVDEALAACRGGQDALGDVLSAIPELDQQVRAMLVLSNVDEALVNPIFSRTDAIGSVMRKKLLPVSKPLQEQINILRK